MATTTTRKRTTTAKSKAEAETKTTAEVVEEPKVEEKPVVKKDKPVKEKKVFKPNDGIKCRSIIQGGLFMEGAKTHMLYEWVEYGDCTDVEYDDLAAAVRIKSQYVFGPLFIVEDDDFIEEFSQLKKFYTEKYTIEDLEGILRKPADKMLGEIDILPKSAKESLKVLAASLINDGELDSVKKIKALDEVLGTNLSLLAEFTD